MAGIFNQSEQGMQPSKIDVWMPLYIGDYLGDTIDLNHAQHGAYLLSMFKYWRKGEALTREELRAVCGKETDRVSQFYVWCDARWHHKRIDLELRKALDNAASAKARAMKGVKARRDAGLLPPK